MVSITGPHVALGMLPHLSPDASIVRVWADYAAEAVALESESPLIPVGMNHLTASDLDYLDGRLAGLGGAGYCFLFASMLGAPPESVFSFLQSEDTRADLLNRRDVNHYRRTRQRPDAELTGSGTDDVRRLLLLNSQISDSDRERSVREWNLPAEEVSRPMQVARRQKVLHPDWGTSAFLTLCCVSASLTAEDATSADSTTRTYMLAELGSARSSNSSRRNLFHDPNWDQRARPATDGLTAGYFIAERLAAELGTDHIAWSLVLNDLEGSITDRIETAKAALT
ncbi:hypothetical protein [Brevibacterium aurantiacum]|nr:hypothetical protein [Brevibacterium aurantiacum]